MSTCSLNYSVFIFVPSHRSLYMLDCLSTLKHLTVPCSHACLEILSSLLDGWSSLSSARNWKSSTGAASTAILPCALTGSFQLPSHGSKSDLILQPCICCTHYCTFAHS
mmetsp:Transcript_32359/g.41476  ORF Transcript_32359/g.41476 Transcript_32359/m.41476 type:complete len:109 (+) Transcript_32359:896-1222(+)